MGWRILQITKPCKLFVQNRQLVYEPQEGDSLKLPLEDISVIILENKQVFFSNSLLSELADYDIVLFTCGVSHLPSGAFFPFHNHSRYSEMADIQVGVTEPLKKRIWQEIVKAKIQNQAEVLKVLEKDDAGKLFELVKKVQSGDVGNVEAYAANLYWNSIWDNFNRNNEDDIRNAALNYGYAVIRGAVARAAVGAGLLPCFGVHHANKLNQFNLVDDLMEPFRPFVDYQVVMMNWDDVAELSIEMKNRLVAIMTQNCIFSGEQLGLLYACESEASSVAKVMKNKDIKYLRTPVFQKLPLFKMSS